MISINVESDPTRLPPRSISEATWSPVRLDYVSGGAVLHRTPTFFIPDTLNPAVLERVLNDSLKGTRFPDSGDLEMFHVEQSDY